MLESTFRIQGSKSLSLWPPSAICVTLWVNPRTLRKSEVARFSRESRPISTSSILNDSRSYNNHCHDQVVFFPPLLYDTNKLLYSTAFRDSKTEHSILIIRTKIINELTLRSYDKKMGTPSELNRTISRWGFENSILNELTVGQSYLFYIIDTP